VALAREVVEGLAKAGLDNIPVVVGGIVPPDDEKALKAAGIAAVYTPKDYDLTRIMDELAEIVGRRYGKAA
jgi:(2R)-ethylmalonyl-CoA mutase